MPMSISSNARTVIILSLSSVMTMAFSTNACTSTTSLDFSHCNRSLACLVPQGLLVRKCHNARRAIQAQQKKAVHVEVLFKHPQLQFAAVPVRTMALSDCFAQHRQQKEI